MTELDKNMLIESFARGRELVLIEKYIEKGPTALREELGLTESAFAVVFDYLVFEHNLLYKVVVANADFFVEKFIEHGMSHIREVLDVVDAQYDEAFDVVFDFIAISKKGLYHHVLHHRDKYMMAFKSRGADFVRKVLGMGEVKYDDQWEEILNILLSAVCDSLFSERTLDEGLRNFSLLMNGVREHRPIWKSGLI